MNDTELEESSTTDAPAEVVESTVLLSSEDSYLQLKRKPISGNFGWVGMCSFECPEMEEAIEYRDDQVRNLGHKYLFVIFKITKTCIPILG